jgi:phosphohistidine phosphatase
MARELLVLRHAKSDWTSAAASDFDRPLAKRGKQQAPKVGHWLRAQGLVPDDVLSSPAKRARQTVKRVCEALGFDVARVRWDPRVYEGTLDSLLQALGTTPARARRVLLVGHNPGLETLLGYLWGDASTLPADGKLLPTAALARLELPEEWTALGYGAARLLSLIRPAEMD